MGVVDADYCELTVSILNYFTGQPYIDTGLGQTSRNIPVQAIEFNDVMYEPKASQMSTATITFPTIIQNPSLYPLLSQIKEGDRVELYHFQPDVGLPVFGGFIPPGGITVQAGSMQIQLQDVMGRGQWERIRPYEDFDTDAAGYYYRAMHHWVDYLNEDWNLAETTNGEVDYTTMYSFSVSGATYNITQGALTIGVAGVGIGQSVISNSKTLSIQPGQRILIECRGITQTDYVLSPATSGVLITNLIGLTNGTDSISLEEIYSTDNGNPHTGNTNRMVGLVGTMGAVTTKNPDSFDTQAFGSLPIGSLPMPASNLYAVIINCSEEGILSAEAFINYVQVAFLTNLVPSSYTGWYFSLDTTVTNNFPTPEATGTTQQWNSLRVRYLQPWLLPASQFNPQTSDATEFQANNDDLYTFLNNFVEIDFAEYRPIYQRYPEIDLLALDGVGLVGINASQRLGIDQLTDQSSPRITGDPAGAEYGDFTNEPLFRFEEGYNMSDFPQIQKSQLTHANNIVRMGSGNTDAQNFYDRWNTSEVGNPFGLSSGLITNAAPQYPYFEALINDDRTSLPDVIGTLAANDLSVRAAGSPPTLAITVADDIRYAFKYRAGDFVRVKTKSLIPNVDEDLRIMSITHEAGNPTRTITVGRLPYDPTLRGQMAKSMVESWLYTQSGAGQLIVIYTYVPITLTPGQLAPTPMPVPLVAATSGTAITYAALHWFTNGTDPVADIQIGISGPADPTMANPSFISTQASGQDSGLINAIGFFPGPGTYYFAPKNAGAASRTVNALFLVIKIKE